MRVCMCVCVCMCVYERHEYVCTCVRHFLYICIHTCARLRHIFEEEKEIGEIEGGLAIVQDVSECVVDDLSGFEHTGGGRRGIL